MSQPRGILLQFPNTIHDLEALPDGARLEPGERVRYKGRFWRVDEAPHCSDPQSPKKYFLTLVNARGQRFCLRCGVVDGVGQQAI